MIFRDIFIKISIIFCVTISVLIVSLNISGASEPNNSQKAILEIVSFKAKKNVATKDILKASNKVTNDLKKYDGFIKRTLTQNTDKPDHWVDIVEWNSLEKAHSSMLEAIDNTDVQNFLSLMKNGERTYQTKSEYLNIQSQTD
ncbi:EbhA protein [Candidatus Francisella endociliophora]|uniref:EbhA protein n=1 Tax=Candidatus Francisella endociliophora TaxID=653937 RepID=A0A097EMD3_9GAMM|nr:EbhA protein [Francisella sp. FSC1006]AIT08734.1 EbhA protein [Francisella sp. FSC1006]